jgi:uncharacterized protein
MRLSSYAILSDPLPGGGHVLMNACTGALDLISDEVAYALNLHGEFRGAKGELANQVVRTNRKQDSNAKEEISNGNHKDLRHVLPFTDELFDHFLRRGHLTEMHHNDEQALVRTLSASLHDYYKKHPAYLIVPNFDCNYRCTYCFERPLQKGLKKASSAISYERKNVVMDSAMIDAVYRSIDFIDSILEVQEKNNMLLLYGGEPLDATNQKVIYELVRKGQSRGYRFSAITNGHDLDQFMPLLGEDGIQAVQITFDGPKEIHDKKRIHRGGNSSFDQIMKNIKAVLAQGGTSVLIRFHIDHKNISTFTALLSVFEEEGFCNHPFVRIYSSPIYLKDSDRRVYSTISESDLIAELQQYVKMYNNVYVSPSNVNEGGGLQPSLFERKPYQINSSYCSATSGQFIFSPDGNVYSCWESIGHADSRIGNYLNAEGVMFDKNIYDAWFHRHSGQIPECLNCPYCLVCRGGCAQYALYNNGSLYSPFCDDFPKHFNAILCDTVEKYVGLVEAAG